MKSNQRPHIHIDHLLSCPCGRAPDGHTRVTKADDFTIRGGSSEGHERMTEAVLKTSEQLAKSGRKITDLNVQQRREAINANIPR